ncbi:hypothetical protein O3M35_008548 [Rhynocoris fuscipes]|uniref:Transglutaminase-like domain-containing protein n=1 Tax=Rhynocoris fuscipes TaxID=488301 RepID=A0AAW1D6P2_9HEMI
MALKVSAVNLYAVENSKAHKTFKYEAVHLEPPTPIFRRGKEFVFDVTFEDRQYDNSIDKLRVLLQYEDEEKAIQRTGGAWLTDKQTEQDDRKLWSLRLISKEGKTIKLKMRTPIKCPILCWKMSIKTSLKEGNEINTYDHPETIYILLNPWDADDDVYMPDTHLLEEYVMNDIGKVYTGTKGRHWIFGQFQSHVLKACRKLFKECGMQFELKGDPILIARMLSRMVNNANPVDGILTGNWSGYYAGGTNPSMWTGSTKILKEYLENGPGVRFGQCWVFASVTCTICRAIGMPARVVTNLVSAHDSNMSLTIDKYYKKNGDIMDKSTGSVWNFHVWNDVWLARPDLPPGYGGWQAIDATPQEESDGIYQCGPASVVAIKRGEVGFNYEMPFVLAEVNADMVDWQEDEEALTGFRRIRKNTRQVGQKLLTKRPHIFDPNGDRDKDDVINQYKEPEGSKEERLTILRAAFKCGDSACESFEVETAREIDEVKFTIEDIKTVFIGKDFTLTLEVENTAEEKRTVQVIVTLWSVYYNGLKGHTIKKCCQLIEVPAKEKKQFNLEVKAEEYLEKLVEFSLMKTHVIASVEETKQTWSGEDEFQITKPPLTIKADGNLEANKPGKLLFIFTNPLKIKLTGCLLAFECSGIEDHDTLPFRDTLPEEKIEIEVAVTPKTSGKLPLAAIFFSKQLHEVTGAATLDVA